MESEIDTPLCPLLPSVLEALWLTEPQISLGQDRGCTSSEDQAGFIEKCHLDHKEPGRAFLIVYSGHIQG